MLSQGLEINVAKLGLYIKDKKEMTSLSMEQQYKFFNLMTNVIEAIEEKAPCTVYKLIPDKE